MTPGPIDEKRARQSRGTVSLEQASETKAIILFVLHASHSLDQALGT